MSANSRNPAMDVIRCFALFCVIAVHFFLHSGFYDVYLIGMRMYIMTLLRNGFMICVPLFILLSGYLMINKTFSHTYYYGLIKTIATYLLASAFCFTFDAIYFERNYSLASFFTTFIYRVFCYSAAPYSWYIEMYIGLFLMIPFLNTLYNNLTTKKQKQVLIFTLVILSSAESLGNIRWLIEPRWWVDPNKFSPFVVLPKWWTSIYPLAYYFLGAYLRESPLKISRIKNIVFIFIAWLVTGSYRYFYSNGDSFIGEPWPTYGSWTLFLLSALIFNFLSQGNYDFIPNLGKKVLSYLSGLCLGAYMLSWIFDTLYYDILNRYQPVIAYRIEYFPLIVACVYFSSLTASAVLNLIYKYFSNLLSSFFLHKTQAP